MELMFVAPLVFVFFTLAWKFLYRAPWLDTILAAIFAVAFWAAIMIVLI